MTADEQRIMRSLSDARLRRNYNLCEQQMVMAHDQGNDDASVKLSEWSDAYLAEMVRRGIQR